MVSSSIIYTLLFTMGLLLMNSMHASSVPNKADRADFALGKANQDDANLSLKKRSVEDDNEYHDYLFGKHRFALRGIRLPSESILLGKRRLPVEAVLLGRRNMANEDILSRRR